MQSKLTLRLEEDVKERAKRLAEERGTSVSALVEQYFRLLLRDEADGIDLSGEEPVAPEGKRDITLSPRIRELKEKLGHPAPSVSVDEDTRRWIEAAAEKHR